MVTFGAEVACKWRDPAMLRCPYFSDENLPSREFGSSSRREACSCDAEDRGRSTLDGQHFEWQTYGTSIFKNHGEVSNCLVKTKGNPTYESERHRKSQSFDSTIMGNPNFHGIIKGHSNFWWEKSWETDWIPSGSTIFGGFRCDQDPDSSNAAWYYANFSNYFIAAGTETCGQIGTFPKNWSVTLWWTNIAMDNDHF